MFYPFSYVDRRCSLLLIYFLKKKKKKHTASAHRHNCIHTSETHSPKTYVMTRLLYKHLYNGNHQIHKHFILLISSILIHHVHSQRTQA